MSVVKPICVACLGLVVAIIAMSWMGGAAQREKAVEPGSDFKILQSFDVPPSDSNAGQYKLISYFGAPDNEEIEWASEVVDPITKEIPVEEAVEQSQTQPDWIPTLQDSTVAEVTTYEHRLVPDQAVQQLSESAYQGAERLAQLANQEIPNHVPVTVPSTSQPRLVLNTTIPVEEPPTAMPTVDVVQDATFRMAELQQDFDFSNLPSNPADAQRDRNFEPNQFSQPDFASPPDPNQFGGRGPALNHPAAQSNPYVDSEQQTLQTLRPFGGDFEVKKNETDAVNESVSNEDSWQQNDWKQPNQNQFNNFSPESSPVENEYWKTDAALSAPQQNIFNDRPFETSRDLSGAFEPNNFATTEEPVESQEKAVEPAVENKPPAPRLRPTPLVTKATAANPGNGPTAALDAGDFLAAGQPELGAHFKDDRPETDKRAWLTDASVYDFSPDPIDPGMPYDPVRQMQVYEGKRLNATQRPLVEIGRPWYQLGQLSEPMTFFGRHNPITPQFIIFGDYRTAFASNRQNDDSVTQVAVEWNMFFNLQLTGTERIHWFVAPFDNGNNTRFLLDDDEFVEQLDFDVDFGYFEGDLGAIIGGFTGQTLPFDLPFAAGVMPLLVQNGIWMEDAFLGVAATIPARNSARLDISNMDITLFAGFDEIISPAFEGEDDAAKMWGVLTFIEAMNGYWEIDYAYLEDRTNRDRSYHNFGAAYTRRYGRFLSNSTRVIVNAGQSTEAGPNTADGVLLLSENSLITGYPSSIVPYLNFFAGFDRPQSAARAGGSGGVLRNTGILFESDGMTGYPTLDATANDTFGVAAGVNILPNDWSQQLVLEMAAMGVMGEDANRNARGDQYGVGARYQLPLTNATILRADAMYGFLRDDADINGVRLELRRKY